eukprot:1160804-Pelagomonas_calceolata.AAC.27
MAWHASRVRATAESAELKQAHITAIDQVPDALHDFPGGSRVIRLCKRLPMSHTHILHVRTHTCVKEQTLHTFLTPAIWFSSAAMPQALKRCRSSSGGAPSMGVRLCGRIGASKVGDLHRA